MNVVIVDDMARAVHMLEMILSEEEGIKIAGSFTDSREALQFLTNTPVDAVFLDVEMPYMTGIDIAGELARLPSPPHVVFVTGYEQYSIDAWKVDAVDYIMKPFNRQAILHALSKCGRASSKQIRSIEVKCFPNFEIFVNGSPLTISNKTVKELLAFLVHNQGEWVDNGKSIGALFEDADEKTAKNHYNVTSYRLRRLLCDAGIGNIIETDYGRCRVRAELLNCDYYRYLGGERHLFHGQYMEDYSWAEPTLASMLREQERSSRA